MSLQTLKRLVKKMIDEEDTAHPLTDDLIAKKLDDAGIHVTRRTVAKYEKTSAFPAPTNAGSRRRLRSAR